MSSSYRLSGKQLQAYRDFAGDGVYLVSIGLEDPEDLCENLAQVLGTMTILKSSKGDLHR